jgi:ketosteroid isomerase-like protein
MGQAGRDPAAVVERLVAAVNAHDLDALAACFAGDYRNETPAHPRRGFRGREQVRRNWAQLFTGVPDLRARVLGTAAEGGRVWTEWELAGTRRDGAAFALRGVVIFGVGGGQITSARFYLEPVEETSGDVDAHTARVAGAGTGGAASP